MVNANEMIELIKAIRKIRQTPGGIPGQPETGLQWFDKINCEDCDCRKIDTIINQQNAVIKGLKKYTDFTKPFPKHKTWATASGYTGDSYKQASQCVKIVIDELESLKHTIAYSISLFIASFWGEEGLREQMRDNEIDRSEKFREYLKVVKWLCC